MSQPVKTIQVAKPILPGHEMLLPFLRQIDDNRFYTNFGPLAERLELALAAHFGVPAGGAALVASGTAGLTAALLSLAPARGGLCLLPAWTFVASAHAVLAAGLVPYLVDVDPESQALTPALAQRALATAPGPVAAAMPVSPYGRPLPAEQWDRFAKDNGLPVVVDAAACFDSLVPGEAMAVVSLHATKVCGLGEGGVVVSRDPEMSLRLRAAANFGFRGDRISTMVASNGKLSEYSAAVGLASLDLWPRTRAAYQAVAELYLSRLADCPGLKLLPGFGVDWISSTLIVEFANGRARAAAQALAEVGADSRFWWAGGLHTHDAFAGLPRDGLAATEALTERVLGLPFHPELGPQEVATVCRVVLEQAQC